MQQVTATTRDPAPSRVAYRLHRLWLTPLFRTLLRVGLPVFVIVFGIGFYFIDQENRDRVHMAYADLRASIETRPEFMVQLMAIDGASPDVAEDIREVLPIDFPISSFDLDIDEMWQQVNGLDAVKSAQVRIRPGGILKIDVTERLPVVVWRNRNGLELLDEGGIFVAPVASRAARPDLPLIAGEGGSEAVSEALALLAATGPIADRVRGLVRQGARRWDVVLDRDQRILLPADNPITALERVIVLDQARELLDREVVAVDMRQPHRPTLRLNPAIAEDLRRVKMQLIEGKHE